MAKLGWCPDCREFSTVTKCYPRADGMRRRVEFCLNKGCGYRADITFPESSNVLEKIGFEKGGAS